MCSKKVNSDDVNGRALYTFMIDKEWKIAKARAKIKEYATRRGFAEVDIAELTTAASELGYNLIFHTCVGGQLQLQTIQNKLGFGVKLISTDAGPGIHSMTDAMTDGFSTNGGLGGGLPGVKRLMDEFYIESSESGTRVECTKWLR